MQGARLPRFLDPGRSLARLEELERQCNQLAINPALAECQDEASVLAVGCSDSIVPPRVCVQKLSEPALHTLKIQAFHSRNYLHRACCGANAKTWTALHVCMFDFFRPHPQPLHQPFSG